MTVYAHNKHEISNKCIAMVYNGHCSVGHQCTRDRGYGECYMFCWQHAENGEFVRVCVSLNK
jgi:hypothetical protein